MKIERIKRLIADKTVAYIKRGNGYTPVTVIDFHLSGRFLKVLPQSALPSLWVETKTITTHRPLTVKQKEQAKRIELTLRLLKRRAGDWITARQFASRTRLAVRHLPRSAGAWLSYLASRGLVERQYAGQHHYRVPKPTEPTTNGNPTPV